MIYLVCFAFVVSCGLLAAALTNQSLSQKSSGIRATFSGLAALIGSLLAPIFFYYSNLGRVVECHTDECIVVEFIFLGLWGFAVFFSVLISLLFCWWGANSKKWILGASLALGISLVGYGALHAYEGSEWQRQNKEAELKQIAERNRQEILEILKDSSGLGSPRACDFVVGYQEAAEAMGKCKEWVELMQKDPNDAYLAWIALRKFLGVEGFASWADGTLKIPPPYQVWFLKTYFDIWMEQPSFSEDVKSGELDRLVNSLKTGWSQEAVESFTSEVLPRVNERLKKEGLK